METQIPVLDYSVLKKMNSFKGRGKHGLHFTAMVLNAKI